MGQPTEQQRTRSARHYLAGGASSTRLQTTIALAAQAVAFPAAMINILDEDTQYTINLLGGENDVATPREVAFCDTVVRSGEPLVVQDAGADNRFARFPAVAAGDIASYIGVPLHGRESLVIGALCVTDSHPRAVSREDVTRLQEFSSVVEDQLDLMRRLNAQRSVGAVVTQELAAAIDKGHIIPWYQPIVDLRSGETVGVEALARWQHQDGEVSDPSRFIPLAEDSDLIVELDLSVIRQAAADVAGWQRERPELRLSVNLSARHFERDQFFPPIEKAIADAGLAPDTVDLELTETARLDSRVSMAEIGEMRDAGFGVWLDDFGTGWSSLEYLLRMPVSGVKIDRALSLALGSRLGNALTTSVTGLAAELGLKTIIEGIETAGQAQHAMDLGCDYGQGYLWSRPMAASDFPGPANC
jgi:EAL domain-containing protein (putative c-di-GMP-specific phosphodiesterase class I)